MCCWMETAWRAPVEDAETMWSSLVSQTPNCVALTWTTQPHPERPLEASSFGIEGTPVVSTEISWVFEAAVKPDALDDYGALARKISADNQAAEPGQEIFEWFIDGQDVHIYERYQDSAAALAHVQRFVENFATGFLSLCTPTRTRGRSHLRRGARRSDRRCPRGRRRRGRAAGRLPITPSKFLPSPGPYRRPSTLSRERFSNSTTTM
jgi:quinol monooxygenase YgiN